MAAPIVEDFRQIQYAFAAHLRDPAQHGFPAVEDRRLKIYRELFYNTVEDCLASGFPVLRNLLSDSNWHAMVRDFYARHVSHAPQFHRVPEEFLAYLEHERGEHAEDPPFLRELAHYEWIELELSLAQTELTPELADPNGDLLEASPQPSPLAQLLAYEWPVHLIGPDHVPDAPMPSPIYLIVNRDRQDRVRFLEVNPVAARLFQLIEERPDDSGRSLLRALAAELGHPQPDAVIEQGAAILSLLRERDIVLGTRRMVPSTAV